MVVLVKYYVCGCGGGVNVLWWLLSRVYVVVMVKSYVCGCGCCVCVVVVVLVLMCCWWCWRCICVGCW